MRGDQIAMVFQDPMTSLNPAFTIGTQLVDTIRLHRTMSKSAARARALELLELVGIPDPERRLGDYPHQLSGGMRQRAMIAMALVVRAAAAHRRRAHHRARRDRAGADPRPAALAAGANSAWR